MTDKTKLVIVMAVKSILLLTLAACAFGVILAIALVCKL